MRYSFRTLLIAVSVVSLLFGGVTAYNSVWQNRVRELESSLCRHIIMDQRKQAESLACDTEVDPGKRAYDLMSHTVSADSTLFVAIVHAGSYDLSPFSPSFLEEFDVLKLAPLTYSTGQRRRFELHIVRWINWTTVVVDHNSTDNPLTGRAVKGATYRLMDGTWELVENGSFLVT